MTISRVKGVGWGPNELITSAQITAVDVNTANALDKRAGQTDTLGSVVSLTGAGRIVSAFATGPDSGTSLAPASITIGSSNNVVRVSTLTGTRYYAVQATGAVSGDQIAFFIDPGVATYEVYICDSGLGTASPLYLLGNQSTSDGQWVDLFFDGSRWRVMSIGQGARLRVTPFTANGSWTAPPGVTEVLLVGCGGGGGGGCGSTGATTTANRAAGGGGGGGAVLGTCAVTVNPGQNYAVSIGTGGPGGTGGAGGGNGVDTTFGSTLATFLGAAGGGGSTIVGNATNGSVVTLGGYSTRGTPSVQYVQNYFNAAASFGICSWIPPVIPGQGGYSQAANTGAFSNGVQGQRSPLSLGAAFSGGAGGTAGADVGSPAYLGGAGGGGGAAGPRGAGGAGGDNGGSSLGYGFNGAGTGGIGAPGSNAGDNTGAGGGGGGGGGAAGTTGGSGGNGGNGGSGFLYVLWVK